MPSYKGVDYTDRNRVRDRRTHPDQPRKTWQVSRIWDKHAEIIRRKAVGQSNTQIAESMSMSQMQVSNVVNSPIVQERLAIMNGARDAYTIDLARDIREFAPKCLDLLKEIIGGESTTGQLASPALKARVAIDVLDRAGYSPVKSVNIQGVHAHLTREDIEQMKQRVLGGTSNAPIIEVSR
jgi:hypothetical protein